MAIDKKQNDKKSDPGKYNFLSASKPFMALSILLTVGSLLIIMAKGFNYGIDFSGGTEVQVGFGDEVDAGQVRAFTDGLGYKNAQVQAFGAKKEYLIRLESFDAKTAAETNQMQKEMIDKLAGGLKSSFADHQAKILRIDSVGPQVGSELKRNGLLAVFYSLIMILIYVGLRFDFKFAPGAVFCLFHDAAITLGIFSLFGREVNIQTLAAVLTIIGYSLNDTIVTFDRIRENAISYRDNTLRFIINRSLNDVLSRTLLTSITTMIAVAAMYIWADGVIQDFAFTLGIGVIVGTYSSIYVATPLVLVFDRFQKGGASANA